MDQNMMQLPAPTIPPWVPVETLTVVTVVLGSLFVVLVTSDRTERWLARLRSRLVLGVPWGTIIAILGVIVVYLFLQGGIENLRDPLVIPFRSWSYFYPLGMLTAAFSHSSLNHVTGNLIGTAMFAPIAEYAWGHYPRRRGTQSFSRPLTNPIVRILVVPATVIVVGLFTAVFTLGPVIGFSGVVFAFAGFALVQRPIATTLAILANRVLGLAVSAIQNPRVVAVPRPRVITPSWASTAIQGHAIGVLSGILLGFGLAYYRDRLPGPGKLWFGLLAFATVQGLWAVFVPLGNGRFVMFRWIGTAVVFALATVIVLATSGEYDLGLSELRSDIPLRIVPLLIVVVLTAALSGAAIPYNAAPIGQADGPESAVEVRDYTVGYGEDIPDGYVNSVSIPGVGTVTTVNTSGVIVTSERRHVWQTLVLKSQLKNRGATTVTVGGVGWQQDVRVNRTGWNPAGNDSVYKVYLRPSGENRSLGFTSEPRRAEPIIDGRNVTLSPTRDGFEFGVARDGQSLGTVSIPAPNSTVTAGGIAFVRNQTRIVAVSNETRVPIATRSGNGQ